ncbi:MAG: DUF1501 domain-containing protein [Bacteroidia bacterium]
MKRREFLQYTGLTSSALMIPGFLKAFESSILENSGKRLVIVQLAGGNDGLNTCIPYQNDIYYSSRPKLAIAKNEILKLTDEFGFNPGMSGFRTLFNQGEMAVYHAVGYPNPDRSHFRSMDIWHTASNSDEYLNTGWLGRLLDANCPGSENPWFALEVDDTHSLSMKGQNQSGFAVKNAQRLKKTLNDPIFSELQPTVGLDSDNSEIGFLYKTLASTRTGAKYISEKASIKSLNSEYPMHEFGNSMKQIAEFVNNGIGSRIFYTGLSGFDTHVRQAETQQRLLKVVSDSINQFRNDLHASGNWKDTVVMVFSEFGRRVKQNGSNGTDHGTANQVYLIGGDIKNAGFRNEAANLSLLDDGDLIHQMDFRNIYATLLDKTIGFDSSKVLGRKFGNVDAL